MVNIELFVNINNPSRLESVMPSRNTTYSCSIYKKSELSLQKAFSTVLALVPCSANGYKPEMTLGNVTVYISTSRS